MMKFLCGLCIAIGLSGLTNVFASQETKTLFGMECEVVRIPNYQQITSPVYSGDYSDLLNQLKAKGYERIDMYQTFSFGGKNLSILMGQKCNRPIVRINGEEARNDIGIDRINQNGDTIVMMGTKDGTATMITCKMGTLSGNMQNILTGSLEISKNIQSEKKIPLGSGFIDQKTFHDLSQISVAKLVAYFGGNWKSDQLRLANMVGIKNYQGTKAQNMKIQAYLLAHGRIPRVATQTSAKTLSASEYQQISHSSVSYIATAVRGYTWPKDRRGLSLEAKVIDPYWGKRMQNMQIRGMLIQKIKK